MEVAMSPQHSERAMKSRFECPRVCFTESTIFFSNLNLQILHAAVRLASQRVVSGGIRLLYAGKIS